MRCVAIEVLPHQGLLLDTLATLPELLLVRRVHRVAHHLQRRSDNVALVVEHHDVVLVLRFPEVSHLLTGSSDHVGAHTVVAPHW
jgi:hypothetical protein